MIAKECHVLLMNEGVHKNMLDSVNACQEVLGSANLSQLRTRSICMEMNK